MKGMGIYLEKLAEKLPSLIVTITPDVFFAVNSKVPDTLPEVSSVMVQVPEPCPRNVEYVSVVARPAVHRPLFSAVIEPPRV